MGLPGAVFNKVVGTPASPTFAEYLIRGHSVESNGSSQAIINQLHFARISGPGTDDENDLYLAVSTLIDTTLGLALSNSYVADDTSIRFMDDPTRAPVLATNLIVGGVTGDRLPSFNAVVTRKLTYGRGRSYKGSNHWAPIAESQTTLDELNAGAQTLWNNFVGQEQNLANTFVALADTWQLIVLSPTLSDFTVNPGLFSGSIVKTISLNNLLGTMKRRKSGVGA